MRSQWPKLRVGSHRMLGLVAGAGTGVKVTHPIQDVQLELGSSSKAESWQIAAGLVNQQNIICKLLKEVAAHPRQVPRSKSRAIICPLCGSKFALISACGNPELESNSDSSSELSNSSGPW